MFCYKCGTQIPDDSVFCPKCGAGLKSAEAGQQPAVEQQPTPQYTQPAPKKSKKGVAVAISISCAVVVIAVVILILLLGGNGRSVFGGGDREALIGLWVPQGSNTLSPNGGYVFGKDGKLYGEEDIYNYTIYEDKKVIVLGEQSLRYTLNGSSLTLEIGASDTDGSNFVTNNNTLNLTRGKVTSSNGVYGLWKYEYSGGYVFTNIVDDTSNNRVIIHEEDVSFICTDDGSRLTVSEGDYAGYYLQYTLNGDTLTLQSYDANNNPISTTNNVVRIY